MTSAGLDAAAPVVLSWLLTYAIHSTLLLAVTALAARRLVDQYAWLDLLWKTAVIAPLVTASLYIDPVALPLGVRWAMPSATRDGDTDSGSGRTRRGVTCRVCGTCGACDGFARCRSFCTERSGGLCA